MVEYIVREELYQLICKMPSVGGCASLDKDDVENAILEAPTADVVEVVRCEKCKYCVTHTCAITGIKTLFCDYGEKPAMVHPTHFCSYGERAVNYESSKTEKR